MPRRRPKPTVLPPRQDRRYGAGVLLSVALHGAAVVLIIVAGTAVGAYAGEGYGPGPIGGGGGGGNDNVQYIELPPMPAAAAASREEAEASDQTAVVTPEPTIEETEQEVVLETVAPRRVVIVEEGEGRGTGEGPGTGTGSGGGVGSGQGTGVGRHQGPGTGGGGVAYAPEPRALLYPFEAAPPSVKGKVYTLHFWVNRRGAVTKVEVEPEIEDADFRRTLMNRLRLWVFYPARTVEGRPVSGEFMVSYEP